MVPMHEQQARSGDRGRRRVAVYATVVEADPVHAHLVANALRNAM
ncbi:MAG: hypothetical protein WBC51_02135 [Vicinamibacterales bacterium]